MYYEASTLSPQHCYHLLTAAVSPRPIAWISTINRDGIINLAPFSFFTVASIAPPVLLFSQINPRTLAAKDTVRNLQLNGECIVNVVSHDLAAAMNLSCGNYPPDTSEMALAGLQPAASPLLEVPGVAAAPLRIHCTLRQQLVISEQAQGGTLMLLDVRGIELNDGINPDNPELGVQLDLIGKLSGNDYCDTRSRFAMSRPG